MAEVQAERYAKWDDDHEAERGRELFYADRPRWRASRRTARQRELDADRADAELEAKQTAESSAKSDAFLSSLGAKVASTSGTASSSSHVAASLDDSTPIKLSLVVPSVAKDPSSSTSIQLPKLSRPATAFVGADEDEDGAGVKRKRELIPLTYDDIDPEAGLTEEEKLERRKQMVKDLVNSIPTDKVRLLRAKLRSQRRRRNRSGPSRSTGTTSRTCVCSRYNARLIADRTSSTTSWRRL